MGCSPYTTPTTFAFMCLQTGLTFWGGGNYYYTAGSSSTLISIEFKTKPNSSAHGKNLSVYNQQINLKAK